MTFFLYIPWNWLIHDMYNSNKRRFRLMYIFRVYINHLFQESFYEELKKLSKQLTIFTFFHKFFLKWFTNVHPDVSKTHKRMLFQLLLAATIFLARVGIFTLLRGKYVWPTLLLVLEMKVRPSMWIWALWRNYINHNLDDAVKLNSNAEKEDSH